MINDFKLNLIKFQLICSLIWSYFIIFFESSKFLSLTFFLLIFFGYMDSVFDLETFKSIFILLFVVLNAFSIVFFLNQYKKFELPNLISIKRLFEKKLKFYNNELFLLLDKLNYKSKSNDQITNEIWEYNKKKYLDFFFLKYFFSLSFFFQSKVKLHSLSKINLIFWFFILINIVESNNIKNLIVFDKEIEIKQKYILNAWIYPPKDSNAKAQFIEREKLYNNSSNEYFLVEKGSKIVTNIFNVKLGDVKINHEFEGRKTILKGMVAIESNIVKYENIIKEGEYHFNIKDNLFQKLKFKFDNPPKISFLKKGPKILSSGDIFFKYEISDENNKASWLGISDKNENLSYKNSENYFNKNVDSKFINYFSLNKLEKNYGIKKVFSFKKNLDHLPVSGQKIYLKLFSKDERNQFGSSISKQLFLSERLFFDPIAKKILKIRKKLFQDEDLYKAKSMLKKLPLEKSNIHNIVRARIFNIVTYLEIGEIEKNNLIETFLAESWKIALFLENNNLESIEKKIRYLKSELSEYIDQERSEEEINMKFIELEKLLEIYLRISNSNLKKLKTRERSSIENDILNELRKDKLTSEELSTVDKAKNFIKKIEKLLNQSKKEEKDLNVQEEIQITYNKQKKLLEKIYKNSEINEKVIREQEEIENHFKETSPKLLEFFSDNKKIVKNIEDIFGKLKNTNEKLLKKKINDAMSDQKIILSLLKDIYKNINQKSFDEKSGQKGSRKSNQEFNDEKFDVPIIFEKNSMTKIIERIRKMTNEEKRSKREKDYLKSLLPDF